MVAHGDGGVFVHHADGDALFGAKPTHACSVAGVKLALSSLNTPSAAQEWVLINHHLIACYVCEVQVVHLHIQIHKNTRRENAEKCVRAYQYCYIIFCV